MSLCRTITAARMPAMRGAAASRARVRSMLVCWLLALLAATASPLIAPGRLELLCSAMGPVVLLVDSDGSSQLAGEPHRLDCPLCLQLAAPHGRLALAAAAAHWPRPVPVVGQGVHGGRPSGAPMPARGPPVRI